MYTVLVAENYYGQASISHLLKKHFRKECSVYTAVNGRDIFHYISQNNMDIILLDMEMPGLNTMDMFRFLQKNDQQQILLPIVSMDAFDHSQFEVSDSVPDYLIRPFSEAELIITMEEVLHHCQRRSLSASAQLTSANRSALSRTDLFRNRLQQYITDHYSDIFSMQEVAQAMNYSDTHFCRLFKQCFHVNFSVYLNEYRVEQAKNLLLSSDIAVKDVSIACGYRDTSYFIRVFKRHTGMTPSDYRIQNLTMTAK